MFVLGLAFAELTEEEKQQKKAKRAKKQKDKKSRMMTTPWPSSVSHQRPKSTRTWDHSHSNRRRSLSAKIGWLRWPVLINILLKTFKSVYSLMMISTTKTSQALNGASVSPAGPLTRDQMQKTL